MHPAVGTLSILTLLFACLAYYFGFRGREVIVGIDLGTSYSVIAVKTEGKVSVIPNHLTGKLLVPSVVFFDPNGTVLVGDLANQQSARDNTHSDSNRIYHAKRYIGRQYEEVANEEYKHPFSIEADDKGFAVFRLKKFLANWKVVSPIEVGQYIIKELIESVNKFMTYKVKSVVVCVPVSFRNHEREHTRKVFTGMGLAISRLIEEPVAAALAYDIHKLTGQSRKVMVFDLGGGTLDITILWVAVTGSITVLGSAGDAKLGGQDFDHILLIELQKQCPDLTIDEAEDTKILLTTQDTVKVISKISGCKVEVTNDQFARISSELLQRSKIEMDLALENQMMSPDNVDDVVLVGGGSRMPIIKNMLKEYFHGTKVTFHTSIDPDTVVAMGAANVLD